MTRDDDSATLRVLRNGLLALALVTTIGIGIELATARHWGSIEQLVAWAAVGLVGLSLGLVVGTPSPGNVRLARVLLVVVVISSLFGVWEHVQANRRAGALDFRYATVWADYSARHQWWLALSGGVGAAPPILPLSLAVTAAMVLLATVGTGSPPHTARA